MLYYIYLYLLTVPIFFIIDMVWLGLVAHRFYQTQLSAFLGPVNWTAAGIFYLLYIAGIIIFAILPGLEANSLTKTLLLGALFGFFTYATYDLTNLATLKDWPVMVVIVDIMWGAFLSGSVAAISYSLAKQLL